MAVLADPVSIYYGALVERGNTNTEIAATVIYFVAFQPSIFHRQCSMSIYLPMDLYSDDLTGTSNKHNKRKGEGKLVADITAISRITNLPRQDTHVLRLAHAQHAACNAAADASPPQTPMGMRGGVIHASRSCPSYRLLQPLRRR